MTMWKLLLLLLMQQQSSSSSNQETCVRIRMSAIRKCCSSLRELGRSNAAANNVVTSIQVDRERDFLSAASRTFLVVPWTRTAFGVRSSSSNNSSSSLNSFDRFAHGDK
jgi:hypothetical protein